MLISLLNDRSLEAVNAIAVKFGKRYRKPKPVSRAKVVEHKDRNFFKKLMQERPERGGYYQE